MTVTLKMYDKYVFKYFVHLIDVGGKFDILAIDEGFM